MAFGGNLDLRFRVTADSSAAQKSLNDTRDAARRAAEGLRRELGTALKGIGRDSEGTFNAVNQLRIGITQLFRGDVGGIPNLVRSFRLFRSAVDDGGAVLKVFDVALARMGATATTAKDLFTQFGQGIKAGAGGIGADADRIKSNFAALGLDLTEALLRPDRAFRTVLERLSEFGPASREGKAALDLLGIAAGDVAVAAEAAGGALRNAGAGMSAFSKAAIVAGGLAVAALAAVAVAAVAVGAAIKGMISTAAEVGTRSRDEFDKLQKSLRGAGLEATNLDRALSQQLTKAADSVKAAFDGLFIQLIRTAGPALTGLLNSVSQLLVSLGPAARTLGSVLGEVFIYLTGVVNAFRVVLTALKGDLLSTIALFAAIPGALSAVIAGQVALARKELEKLKTPPAAVFDAKGGKEETDTRLRNLDIQLRAAQRVFKEETEAAERAFERRETTAQAMIDALIAAERKLFAEQKRIFEEERKLVASSVKGNEDKATALAEIRERELQATSDYNRRITQIGDEQQEREEKAVRSLIELIQEASEARRELNAQLADLALESRQARLDIDRINLEQAKLLTTPEGKRQALEKELQLEIDAETLRNAIASESFRQQQEELEAEARTNEERLRIQAEFNRRKEEEDARSAAIIEQLTTEAQRARERLDPFSARSLLGEGFADVLTDTGSVVEAIAAKLQESFGAITSASQAMSASVNLGLKAVFDILGKVTSAIGQMAQAWVLTGKTGSLAVRKLVASTLASIAAESLVQALYATALGFLRLAQYDFSAAKDAFISAGFFAAIAAGTGLAGRAIAGDAFQQGAGGGAGGGGNSDPQQININRGGTGDQLGVGQSGTDLAAGGLFGQAVVAIQRVGESVGRLEQKIIEMTPGNVVAVGAGQATNEIGQAVVTEARRSADFTNDFGRVLFGPA